MAGSERQRAGEILAVIHWARKYEAPLRVDLLRMGTSLEKCSYGWNNLHALFIASPPNTALHHAFNEHWSLADHLLATCLDRLNVLLWTKTKDAHKKPPRNMPKRIPRPGVDQKKKSPEVEGSKMDLMEFLRRQKESGRTEIMYKGGVE